jgi:Tfp pilus assembly protein PilN
MRAVNLLPAPRAEKRQADGPARAQRTKTVALAAAAVLVLIAALLAVAFVQARSHASDRQKTLDGLQAKSAALQASAAASAARASKSQAHMAAVTTAASGRVAWDGLLNQLSRVMPSGAWLESMQTNSTSSTSSSSSSSSSSASPSSTSEGSAVVTSNGLSSSSSSSSAASQSPTSVVQTGYARSQDIVAQALSRLALMPTLSDIALQSTERTDVGNHKAIQFTINANVSTAGGNG